MRRQGHATIEGTRRFHERHAPKVVENHRRDAHGLAVSSLGIGTYLGELDDATDTRYIAAIKRAYELGINVIDTAVNYRAQRSERAVGKAIAGLPRDEIVVCSKAGFLPFDTNRPADPGGYMRATYVDSGLIPEDELVQGCHSLNRRFLADQLEKSRENLGLETIDVYYLHNPETQLAEVQRDLFMKRVRLAFQFLEDAVTAGHIRYYGAATWGGYREQRAMKTHLDLAEMVKLAVDVAGDGHHFKFIQVPLNRAMPEAATRPTQHGDSSLEAAKKHGMFVMSSASIHQGKLDRGLEWTRSQPGNGVALVGMSRIDHLEANVKSFAK
jgi:aryl-alcohol dehydrogenase-like predicted oxidoreductase